jgi:hypothetical protein
MNRAVQLSRAERHGYVLYRQEARKHCLWALRAVTKVLGALVAYSPPE